MTDKIKKIIENKIREVGIIKEREEKECIVLLSKIESYNPSFMLSYCGNDTMIITVRFKKDNEYLDEIPKSFNGIKIIVLLKHYTNVSP